MATTVKTIVATGCSSGIGFELVKHLLTQPQQPYRLILGVRDRPAVQAACDGLGFDAARHQVAVLPLDLADMRTVRTFARDAAARAPGGKIDYLLLNAATCKKSDVRAAGGSSRRQENYVVNHLAQHYLIHLLREKLVESKSRIVVVSSGGLRDIKDPGTLESVLEVDSDASAVIIYCAAKFVQLLGAHWWRRQLQGQCTVVAVSPGFIYDTGLGQYVGIVVTESTPGAKSPLEGALSILGAFERDDFPEDPERIFLTSWGEWWPKDEYGLTLDRELQEKWSPSKEEIEKEEGLAE